jgi:hypothetical protein
MTTEMVTIADPPQRREFCVLTGGVPSGTGFPSFVGDVDPAAPPATTTIAAVRGWIE